VRCGIVDLATRMMETSRTSNLVNDLAWYDSVIEFLAARRRFSEAAMLPQERPILLA
jgi:hypothetical protein